MKAIFTIGCPGAGKTTYARTLLDADPLMMSADLDALRIAAWGGKKRYWAEPNSIASHGLDRMMLAAMETAWLMERNIVFPNTNLRPAAEQQARQMRLWGYEVGLVVMPVPLDVLIARNASRPPDDLIREDTTRSYFKMFLDPDAWWRKEEWMKSRRFVSQS